MKLGIELIPNQPIEKLIEYSKLSEDLNYTNLWVTDHYNNMDIYTILGIIAINTKKIILGVGVTNLHSRHLLVTASGITTIREISNGRLILGLGPGDINTMNTMGIQNNKDNLLKLKSGIPILKDLFFGNKISTTFNNYKIQQAKLSFIKNDSYIPIYIGAQGPKLLDLSCKIADGVLLNLSNVDEIKSMLKLIKNKTENKNFEVCAYTCFSIDDNEELARKKTIPIIGHIISGLNEKLLSKYKISIELKNEIKNKILLKKYNELNEIINDNIIDQFSISGDISYCKEKIQQLSDLGIEQTVIGSPIGPHKKKSIKLIGDIISKIN